MFYGNSVEAVTAFKRRRVRTSAGILEHGNAILNSIYVYTVNSLTPKRLSDALFDRVDGLLIHK